MRCPHCLENFHENWDLNHYLYNDPEYQYWVRRCTCPACKRAVIQLGKVHGIGEPKYEFVHPKGVARTPLPPEVDDLVLISDYKEACLDLADNLDYVRVVGNFAAHPEKSQNSGEVLNVEPEEAEWNLGVVEDLMDFYFVRPARTQMKKAAVNQKLKEAGKPELK